jgi:low temperature requirement protein LtrA
MTARGDNGGGWGTAAGSTVLLVQVLVLFPGLFAVLLLTAALLAPLLVLGLPLALAAGLYRLIRALGHRAARAPAA